MIDTLMIYLKHPYSTQSESSEVPFNNIILGELLGADIGYPLTADGQYLLDVYEEKMFDVLEHMYEGVPRKVSSAFHEQNVVSDRQRLSTRVRLRNGNTVNIGDYDIVLVSHLWAYNYYIKYIIDIIKDVKIICLQEESVQDVMACSSELQMTHLKILDAVSGYVVTDDRYRSLIEPIAENILKFSLPIPKGQFEGVSTKERHTGRINIGVGIMNIDFSNFYSNILVLEGLRALGHDVKGSIIGIETYHQPWVSAYTEHLDYIETNGFLDEEYYDYLANMELAILLTSRTSQGRVAAELAGIGVPCIGSKHVDLQQRCWPDLSVDPYDVQEATTLADELLRNEELYKLKVSKAKKVIKSLQSHTDARAQLREFVDKIHHSK